MKHKAFRWMADMGGNAEYSYISWMDLRRS